ncbi:sensor histidine kinase TodS [Kordia sp. SMS9]|uniref:tetratricopeptide repeat-containing sensor histidine kinase n=1 Tax=Kordia sp. SMS9 TaxID=2282170 RepID=UPI000E0D2E3B|nr:tetratricopeptide repeat-containing sensor histidine kinase [Kordia sp. SMS9]AXG71499.1 sensor histidine kinase TodS [Kordia sp. SMS9]
MKRLKVFFFGIVFLTCAIIHGQNTYTNNWFENQCNFCKSKAANSEKIFLENETSWHLAHVSLTENNLQLAKLYILKDNVTNDTIKQLFQNHLLLKLEVEAEAKRYFLTIQNTLNTDIQQFVYKNLGSIYLKNNQHDSANFYFKKSLAVPIQQSNLFKNEIIENQAYIHLSNNKFDEAYKAYQKILKSYKNKRDNFQIAKTYSNLGNLYFEQYKDELAEHYFDSAYTYSKSIKDLELKSTITYNKYLISEVLKKHEEAINYLKEHSVINDSLQKQNAIWEVAQEKEAFNIAQKQAELDLKTAERNTFIAISAGILLLFVIGFVFYRKLIAQNKKIKKLNRELNETNTVKNQLFTIIAHDLRSPVARLKQLFQIRAMKKDSEAISSDKNVSKIIDSLSLLLDNLLNWSLSQSDLLSVQKEWFPLWQIIRQIELQYQSLIEEKGIQFSTDIKKSILVYGDMEIFKIIIRNCLDNAIKFTPEGGKIIISGEIEDESFTVFITDSGIGIPEKVLKSIFEIKSKKVQKDTSGRKSSGLGLMLTKSMIQLNGGNIKIKQNPTGGTIVNISLPYKNVA